MVIHFHEIMLIVIQIFPCRIVYPCLQNARTMVEIYSKLIKTPERRYVFVEQISLITFNVFSVDFEPVFWNTNLIFFQS